MATDKLRLGILLLAPLAYGLVAFWAVAAADRSFDERMLRDRRELAATLQRHGAAPELVADVLAYEGSVSHDVASLVHTSATAAVGALMFLGATLGGALVFRERREGRGEGG